MAKLPSIYNKWEISAESNLWLAIESYMPPFW
jgi:hypothetical protein